MVSVLLKYLWLDCSNEKTRVSVDQLSGYTTHGALRIINFQSFKFDAVEMGKIVLKNKSFRYK